MYWMYDIDSDLNTLIAQNITNKTPNQSYCIIMDTNLVGFVHFYNYDENNNTVFMGYLLDKEYQGKGIMIDACMKIIPMIFENYTVKEIIVITVQDNTKSKSLIHKLGFKQTEQFYVKDKEFEIYYLQKSNYSLKTSKLWH